MTVRNIIRVLLVLITVTVGIFFLAVSAFRDKLFDLYMHRLDTWVSNGGNLKTIQSEVVENCGQLILSQVGFVEDVQLSTFYRDEFDFRVDVCAKMTVNRLYKPPEFEKPEIVDTICDDKNPYHELFRRLCRRSGLRPPT
jgi:hypothetical protein